mmetsp:Transcript_30797/g.94396  ORF Transcript_30797/g.94396 Transcript_30797/m.94396 type:complete len:139 (-) Transcript_30797:409-825(-)
MGGFHGENRRRQDVPHAILQREGVRGVGQDKVEGRGDCGAGRVSGKSRPRASSPPSRRRATNSTIACESFLAWLTTRTTRPFSPFFARFREEEDERSATQLAVKTLCIPYDAPPLPEGTKCFISGKPAICWTLWGRSY